VSGRPVEEIQKTRQEIVKKVTMRRRSVWYRNYQLAMQKYEQRDPPPAWKRWLVDESAEAPTQEMFENLTVAEELEDHPILRAVSVEVQNELRKHVEDYPGLELKPGVQRFYPYQEAGCHVLGTLSRVTHDDLKTDPNVGKDELRQYLPNDLIGRSGLEKLGEPLLRGSRGKIVTIEGREGEVGRVEFVPGRPVQTTIDIELQQDVANLFRFFKISTKAVDKSQPDIVETVSMHGAAVVIDVATNEVRALVSCPTFDLNDLDEKYEKLNGDQLNMPLLNRATMLQNYPGSTVKPMVGLGAITDGLIGVNQGIECKGYLEINGKRISPGFRCWTASKFEHLGYPIEHHKIPYQDPHVGHDGNDDGSLTFADALQRSCNVYFETLGDRFYKDVREGHREGLSKWFFRFGLGRPTGIGLAERRGMLPWSDHTMIEPQQKTWYSAIGQVRVEATPIQMANVVATIARNGIWMRPKLVRDGQGLVPTTNPDENPDRVDLHLKPEALAAARDGMVRVVNTEGGTGKQARRPDFVVAGKTGTATTFPLKYKHPDENGNVVAETLRPATAADPNPVAPWYRGSDDGKTVNHAWFIGFAPAEDPKIAVCVFVEYGLSGGAAAGTIAGQVFGLCMEKGYLTRKPQQKVASSEF
jgi:penicillin-binding protein 2